MRVAVVGTGFLGEALCSVLKERGHDVVMTHYTHRKFENSLSYDFFNDDPRMIFSGDSIDIVIISAKIEFTEDSAALGQAMEHFLRYFEDSRIVYISSDGIFDGKRGMYTESDQPHPVTLYGRNLELCENLVRLQAADHCIIRPSYMYGFVGGVLDERLETARTELNHDKELTRFTDMYKSPLSYSQAAEIIANIALSDYVGVVHISGDKMSVYDFTHEGMEALGVPTNGLPGITMPFPRPAGMLADTSLDNILMKELTHTEPCHIRESLQSSLQ